MSPVPFSVKALIRELIFQFYMQHWFITCYCVYYFVVLVKNYLFENKSDDVLKSACFLMIIMVMICHAIVDGTFGDFRWFVFIRICMLCVKRNSESWSNRIGSSCIAIFVVIWYIAFFVILLLIRQIFEWMCDWGWYWFIGIRQFSCFGRTI